MARKWKFAGEEQGSSQPMVNTNPSAGAYNYRWRKRRKQYLAMHPLCVACSAVDRTRAATDIDHIKAHRGDLSPEAFWDEDNWQALCSRCHAQKTANESNQGRRVVVTGLMGAGKTSYVANNTAKGDVVFDYDKIIKTIIVSHKDKRANPTDVIPLMESFRYALVEWVCHTATKRNVWIICTSKTTASVVASRINADIIDLA